VLRSLTMPNAEPSGRRILHRPEYAQPPAGLRNLWREQARAMGLDEPEDDQRDPTEGLRGLDDARVTAELPWEGRPPAE
jgi:hypothetical protein